MPEEVSKDAPGNAQEDTSDVSEECKGGDCPLSPQFEQGGVQQPDAHKVRLTTSKYVQLLIDARETDPDCWPPGLEKAAQIIERARAIEEECVDKWGEFDPEKLSRAHSREYFEIQLALDTLQDEADDSELNLEAAINEARQNLDEQEQHEQADDSPPHISEPAPSGGFDLPSPSSPPSSGFFAAPIASTPDDDAVLSLLLSEASEPQQEATPIVVVGANWQEMPSLPRPENYA